MMEGSGWPPGPKGPKNDGAHGDGGEHRAGKDEVFPKRAGHKRNAVGVGEMVVLLDVGRAMHEPAGHGPLVDAELENHPHVQEYEQKHRAGNDKDMQREETRERCAGNDGTAEEQMNQAAADERHAAHDGRADAEAPIRILIEAKNLAGEGHAKGHEQQKDAEDPSEFAGKFVSAEEKHLRHVDEHDGDHEVRSPAMQRAEKPAEGNLMVENVQAVPCLAAGRDIDERQQNAGEDLQEQQRECGAAKDVKPARRASRNGMQDSVFYRGLELKALLTPVVDTRCGLLHPWHRQSPEPVEIVTSFAVLESVGIWPASIFKSPETICQL